MKLVIVGAKGMLGQDLAAACRRTDVKFAGFDLSELDITKKLAGTDALPACDWLINCAAYTDVDGAESHREQAFSVNADGAKNVAEWCRVRGTPLLHISTDYVFDGDKGSPYKEDDAVHPLNLYGESKLAGEKAVLETCERCLIVRTQSLFGVHGRNFVKAIMNRLEQGAELRVVTDQISSPTYTGHFADAILRLITSGLQGIVHVSASGSCSWHEFASAIAERVKPGVEVLPTTAAEYKRPARRPAYSVFDNSRYESWTGQRMPSWQDGLDAYLRDMGNVSVESG